MIGRPEANHTRGPDPIDALFAQLRERRLAGEQVATFVRQEEAAVQLRSLHPGVTVAQVQEATGFALHVPAGVGQTADPTPEQLALLAQLDPKGLRHTAMGA